MRETCWMCRESSGCPAKTDRFAKNKRSPSRRFGRSLQTCRCFCPTRHRRLERSDGHRTKRRQRSCHRVEQLRGDWESAKWFSGCREPPIPMTKRANPEELGPLLCDRRSCRSSLLHFFPREETQVSGPRKPAAWSAPWIEEECHPSHRRRRPRLKPPTPPARIAPISQEDRFSFLHQILFDRADSAKCQERSASLKRFRIITD